MLKKCIKLIKILLISSFLGSAFARADALRPLAQKERTAGDEPAQSISFTEEGEGSLPDILQHRGAILQRIYPGLSTEAKKILLLPDILTVFLGVKPAFVLYEDIDIKPLANAILGLSGDADSFGLLFTNDGRYIVSLSDFMDRLDIPEERQFLIDKNVMSPRDIESILEEGINEHTLKVITKYLVLYSTDNPGRTVFNGFILGYPLEDIDYVLSWEPEQSKEVPRTMQTKYGLEMISRGGPNALYMLGVWTVALDYGYGLFADQPDFPGFEEVMPQDALAVFRQTQRMIGVTTMQSQLQAIRSRPLVDVLRPQAVAEKDQDKPAIPSISSGENKKKLAELEEKLAKTRKKADALFGKAQKSIVELGDYDHVLVTANRAEGDGIVGQAYSLLADIDRALYLSGARAEDIVKMDVFMRDLSQRRECELAMAMHYGWKAPAANFIQQPPANGDLLAIQVLAQTGRDTRVRQVGKNVTLVESGGMNWAYIAGIEPDEEIADPHEQTLNVLGKMNALLEAHGFKFENVLRTWIYLRHIVEKENGIERYAEMNLGRKEFFYTAGAGGQFIKFGNGFIIIDPNNKILELKTLIPPASTGIGTSSGSLVMSCIALQPLKGVKIQFLENPKQISAYAYPEDVLGQTKEGPQASPLFSRGLAVIFDDYKIIFVSGTASIEDKLSVHEGDIKKQTDTTIENISLVLGQAGATLKNIFQLTAYIKNQEDYETVRSMVEARFPRVPCAYLIADVCRPELLVEIEAVAYMQPPSSPRAASEAILSSILRPLAQGEKTGRDAARETILLMEIALKTTGSVLMKARSPEIIKWFSSQLRKAGIVDQAGYLRRICDSRGRLLDERREEVESLFNGIILNFPLEHLLIPSGDGSAITERVFTASFVDKFRGELEYFEREVVPLMLDEKLKTGEKKLRIKVGAMSTGEEIASIYYYLKRGFAAYKTSHPECGNMEEWDIEIRGMDISQKVAAEARQKLLNRPGMLRVSTNSGGPANQQAPEIIDRVKKMSKAARSKMFKFSAGNIAYGPHRRDFLQGGDVIFLNAVFHYLTPNSFQQLSRDLFDNTAFVFTNTLRVYEECPYSRGAAEIEGMQSPLLVSCYVIAPPGVALSQPRMEYPYVNQITAVRDLFDTPGDFLPTHLSNFPMIEDYDRTSHVEAMAREIEAGRFRLPPSMVNGLKSLPQGPDVYEENRRFAARMLDACESRRGAPQNLKSIIETTVFDEHVTTMGHFDFHGVSDNLHFPLIVLPRRGEVLETLRREVDFAKNHMGGIVAPFSILENVKVQRRQRGEIIVEEFPFIMVQKRLVGFKSFHMLPEACRLDRKTLELFGGEDIKVGRQVFCLREKCIARGIVYTDPPVYDKYGLDPDTGTLYLLDFVLLRSVNWGGYLTLGGVLPNRRGEGLEPGEEDWGIIRGQRFEVPDIEIPGISMPAAAKTGTLLERLASDVTGACI